MRAGVEILAYLVGVSVAVASVHAAPPVRLENGGFESWQGARPAGWQWNVNREAKATLARDGQVRHGGRSSVRMSSRSPQAPHVYGGLAQSVRGLLPLSRYRVKLWLKGHDVGTCWFGGGPGWKTRWTVPKGTYDWRRVEGEFTTGPDASSWELRINVDSVTGALWVDDVAVEWTGVDPKRTTSRWLTVNDLVAESFWPVVPVKRPPVIDGEASEWSAVAPKLAFPSQGSTPAIEGYRGAADLSFSLRGSYDAQGLYLLIDVVDDKHVQSQPSDRLWWSDSIQVAFDPGYDRTPLAYDDNDLELGVALAGRRVVTSAWHGGKSLSQDLRAAVRRTGQRTVYELAIAWDLLGVKDPSVGTPIGFNILVNDDDGEGRRGYLQWTTGIGKAKDPSSFATLALSAPGEGGQALALVKPRRRELCDDDVLMGQVYAVFPRPATAGEALSLTLCPAGGGAAKTLLKQSLEPRQGVYTCLFAWPPDEIPSGRHELAASLEHGRLLTRPVVVTKSAVMQETRQRLDAVAKRLPEVKKRLEQARARKLPIDYPQLKLAVVERFIGYGHDDVHHHRIKRAGRVADHIERLLDDADRQLADALAGKVSLPIVPRFRTGKVEVDRWHFVADTEVPSTGKRERRPVFFNGYGHFAQARRDIPNLQAFGANLIQIERGPNSTVKPGFEVDLSVFDDYIMGALRNGARHHVMVCVLMSPHYFPDWAYAHWPELHNAKGGFIKFTIDAPQARRVHETHLKAATGRIKGAPALHSVCLSNEPIYVDSREDKHTQRMWPAYLRQRHGTIDELNRRYGTRYASFEAVAIPAPSVPPPPRPGASSKVDVAAVAKHRPAMAVLYDWVRFNNQRFSDWHRWMAGVVHGVAPEIRVHAKIMPTIWARSNIACGVDPEQFCRLSDLNGNDCWQMILRSRGDRYACNWITEAMFYDLLASMRTAPVVNTEDHLIRDRDELPVPAGHTYTVLWQGAIRRLGASMVWVWERTYDRKHDFAGSILHRPENVEAAGRAHLDLMRLSRQVVALQDAPRSVGLLFSIAAIVHDEDYLPALQRSYEALCLAGVPVRFVSEGQAAGGEYGEVRALIVPRAVHTPPAVAKGIARFAAGGGHVVLVGEACLTQDEYGHPIAGPFIKADGRRVTRMAADLVTRRRNRMPGELRDALVQALGAAGVRPAAVLTDDAGRPVVGIEWQAVAHRGRTLVNLVNLTKEPIRFGVSVAGRAVEAARDLIGLRDVRLPAEARSLEPMLLEIGG